MKIVAVVSAKGGVGKTTVAANLSTALQRSGQHLLTVDLDPQNALKLHQGLDVSVIDGVSRATLGGRPWREIVMQTQAGIYALPYGAVNEDDRRAFEAHLEADPDWLTRGLQSLFAAPDDIVVIDVPPGPSVYMRQALNAANFVIVVTLPDAASYATLPMMEGLIQTYCSGRPGFLDHAYVINQLDSSRQLAKDVAQVMRENFGSRVIAQIHQDEAVREALAYDTSVLTYRPQCQATVDFIGCAEIVTERLG